MSHEHHTGSGAVPGASPGPLRGLLLDVGGDVGALVLLTDGEWDGHEIEVSPVGRDDARTHAVVHAHAAEGVVVFAAVFVALAAGRYTVWRADGGIWGRVRVDGGSVAQLDVRAGRSAASPRAS